MAKRNVTDSSISTLQIFGLIVVVLVTLIALGVMFVPSRPEAPETTRIEYAAPPADKDTREARTVDSGSSLDFPEIAERAAKRREQRARDAAPAEAPPAEAAPYRIFGEVVDSKTGEGLRGARIEATLTSPGAPDTKFDAKSDREGKFEVPIQTAGSYRVDVLREDYVPAKIDLVTLSDDRVEHELLVKMSTGAKVLGKVREAGSLKAIAGLKVQAVSTRSGTQKALAAGETGENGEYTISGLEPGEFGVTVLLANTAYKVGEEIPYREVSIQDPDEEKRGVDFTVDPAGVVWGYILKPDNEPVAGAEVILTNSQSVLSQALSAALTRQRPIRDRSAEDGYYNLLGAPLNQELMVYATSNDNSPQLGEAFILTPKQREVRVDLYVFSGSTISGRVLTLDGTPVAEADVACIPSLGQLTASMRSAQAFRGVRSQPDGFYELKQLPPGSYQIYARKQGFRVDIMGQPVYPDGYSDIKNYDIYLQPIGQGEHAVFGIVVDDSGVGISGVHIELAGLSMDTMEAINIETDTDAKGNFRFNGLTQGNYRLTATHPGYTTRTVRKAVLNEEIRIQMSQTARIVGRVLKKEGNTPVANFTVRATPLQDAESGMFNMRRFMANRPEVEVTNSADGAFALEVDAGYYEVEATAEGFTAAKAQTSVAVGQVSEEVLLYLSEEGASIEGLVKTKDRGSPNGAAVYVVDANTASEVMFAMSNLDQFARAVTRVGDDGVFFFDKLPAGSYTIVARHELYPTAQSQLIVLEEGGEERGVEVTLGSGGGVEGYVYRQGNPAAGATVVVVGTSESRTTQTDNSGYYSVNELPPGTYQVMVTSLTQDSDIGMGIIGAMYDRPSASVEITEGQMARQDFGTGDGTTIQGHVSPRPGIWGGQAVLTPPGAFFADLDSFVSMENMLSGYGQGVDASGDFMIENVPPGEWQLHIFYLEPGGGAGGMPGLRYVHTELLQVSGEDIIPLDILTGF